MKRVIRVMSAGKSVTRKVDQGSMVAEGKSGSLQYGEPVEHAFIFITQRNFVIAC